MPDPGSRQLPSHVGIVITCWCFRRQATFLNQPGNASSLKNWLKVPNWRANGGSFSQESAMLATHLIVCHIDCESVLLTVHICPKCLWTYHSDSRQCRCKAGTVCSRFNTNAILIIKVRDVLVNKLCYSHCQITQGTTLSRFCWNLSYSRVKSQLHGSYRHLLALARLSYKYSIQQSNKRKLLQLIAIKSIHSFGTYCTGFS